MRKIREILRLKHELGLGLRQIARSQGLSHSTVSDYLARAEAAGITWPLPEDLDDAALEARLFPGNGEEPRRRPEPDWAWVHRELRRKGVTLQLLWLEYKQEHPDGYQYSRFCDLYTDAQGRDLLEVVDDRAQARSTIVASQLPVEHWHGLLPDPTVADAILDRLVHNAHKIALRGESMRKMASQLQQSDQCEQ